MRTVAGEGRVRVAVDEPGDGAEPPTVDLVHVAVDSGRLAHGADRLDQPVAHENECVLHDLDLTERGAAERAPRSGRRRELREVADEEPAHRGERQS